MMSVSLDTGESLRPAAGADATRSTSSSPEQTVYEAEFEEKRIRLTEVSYMYCISRNFRTKIF